MKGWVGLVGWPVADGLPTWVVTHQLQVQRRTGKVCRPKTDVLSLCHATNSRCKLMQHCSVTVRSMGYNACNRDINKPNMPTVKKRNLAVWPEKEGGKIQYAELRAMRPAVFLWSPNLINFHTEFFRFQCRQRLCSVSIHAFANRVWMQVQLLYTSLFTVNGST